MAKLYKLHDKLDDLALYLMTNKQGHVDILLDYVNIRNPGVHSDPKQMHMGGERDRGLKTVILWSNFYA